MPAKRKTAQNIPPRYLTILLAILTIILALLLWLVAAKSTVGSGLYLRP